MRAEPVDVHPSTGSGRRKVVVAPDKFKGCLPAAEVAAAVARGVRSARPEAETVLVPVADGGDGTVAAALSAGWAEVVVDAVGPTGEPVRAAYARQDHRAVVELAEVVGLDRLPGGPARPAGRLDLRARPGDQGRGRVGGDRGRARSGRQRLHRRRRRHGAGLGARLDAAGASCRRVRPWPTGRGSRRCDNARRDRHRGHRCRLTVARAARGGGGVRAAEGGDAGEVAILERRPDRLGSGGHRRDRPRLVGHARRRRGGRHRLCRPRSARARPYDRASRWCSTWSGSSIGWPERTW